jgi:ADP-heptose:LPS heptosyltransferase
MPRFLILQLARFGDLVQTGRLIKSLQTRGEVHLCLDRSLAPLAGILYPGVTIHSLAAHSTGQDLGTVFHTARSVLPRLAAEDFEEVYNLNYSGLSLALSTLFEPERVRGHVLEAGQPLMDHWAELAFRWTRRRQNAPINLVDYWAWLDASGAPSVSGSAVNPPAAPGGRGIGVVLAGRNARRSLPPEVLAPIIHTLAKARGAKKVFLLGGTGEREAARELLRHASSGLAGICEDRSGRTDWQGLVDALIGLDLVLTPDTGTMHLAAHLGVPVLACFLSSAWAFETGPYGKGHSVLQATSDCAPCVESRPCDNELACLEPFRRKETLRFLATGMPRDLPPDLALLEPRFDALGQWLAPVAGQDPRANERAARRAWLAADLGLWEQGDPLFQGFDNMQEVQDTVDALCLERDWMTENRKPGARGE